MVFAAIILGQPQPKVNWEKEIIPLARAYMNNGDHATTSATTTTAKILSGLTVVVTGATSGIGKALTLWLVSRGATVIATGRSKSKLNQLLQDAVGVSSPSSDTGDLGDGRIVPIMMEMSDLDSVAAGVDQIKTRFDSVDIVVCNAGMHYSKGIFRDLLSPDYWTRTTSPVTKQGLDVSFTVNYLSHVLLTEKLLPELNHSATHNSHRRPVVVHLSSSYHWGADGRDLDPVGGHSPIASQRAKIAGTVVPSTFRNSLAYSNSKLAQILHARALRHYLQQQGQEAGISGNSSWLRTVSVCPAWVATSIGGDEGSVGHMILALLAFSLDDNKDKTSSGVGLASTLRAMFDGSRTNTSDSSTMIGGNIDAYNNDDVDDFFINSNLSKLPYSFPYQYAFPTWVTDIGLRTLVTDGFAIFLLLFQKPYHTASPARSSVESYDMDLAMRLYNWSKEVIKEYL